VAVLVLVAGAVARWWLVPERFREPLAASLTEALARPVALEGDLVWTFWPRPGLRAGQLRISRAGEGDPLLEAEGAVLRVGWLPLLRGELVPASLTLEQVRGRLPRLPGSGPGGERNAGTGGLRHADLGSAPSPGQRFAGEGAGASLAVRIHSGWLRYRDPVAGQRARLEGIRLAARVKRRGRAWLARDLSLQARLGHSRLPGGELAVQLAADVAADPRGARIADGELRAAGARLTGGANWDGQGGRLDANLEVTDPRALTERLGDGLPENFQPAMVAGGEGRLRLAWQPGWRIFAVPELYLATQAGELEFRGRGQWQAGEPVVRGAVAGAVADAEALLPLVFGSTAPISAGAWDGSRLSGELSLRGQGLRLDDLALRTAGVTWRGQVAAERTGAGLAWSGRLASGRFSPRQLAERLGRPLPALRGDTALRQARLEAGFGLSNGSLTLAPLSLTLDGTRIAGDAAFRWEDGAVVRWNLSGGSLNLDRYLPAGGGSDGARQSAVSRRSLEPLVRLASAEPAAPLATTIPDWLRRLDARGRLRLEGLVVAGMPVRDVEARIRGRQGRLRASPVRGRLHGGSAEGAVTLDVTEAHPRWTLEADWSDVALAPVQAALLSRVRIRGAGSGHLTLEAQGWRPGRDRREWNGEGRLEVAPGSVAGIDLGNRLRRNLARLQGDPPPAEAEDPATPFESLRARYYIEQGRLHVTSLEGHSDWLRADGQGKADLVDRAISARGSLTVTGRPPGGPAALDRLEGVAVPLRATGTLEEPRLGLDLSSLLRAERDAEGARELRRQRQRLRQEAEDKLKDLKERLQKALE
jgi:hypothetical protein